MYYVRVQLKSLFFTSGDFRAQDGGQLYDFRAQGVGNIVSTGPKEWTKLRFQGPRSRQNYDFRAQGVGNIMSTGPKWRAKLRLQ